MGRLIIKRSIHSKYGGGGLVFRRGPFTKNTRAESIQNQDEILHWKSGKGIADADVHMIAYYSTPESCTRRSTSRSNEEKDNNADNNDDDGDNDESMNQSTDDDDDDDYDDESINQSADEVPDGKRKFPQCVIDSIVNGESQMPPQAKIRCLDDSIEECREHNKQLKDMDSEHAVSKIPPTERKKWPQKPCVHCWKSGGRNDTRYICLSCKAALCKEPCFSEYHCTK